MPSRPTTTNNSRPAPVPTMDVYTADGTRCYSVPKGSISHRGHTTATFGAPTANPTTDHSSAAKGAADMNTVVAMGPVLCSAYCDLVAKKAKGSSPSASPNDAPAASAAVGCPLGSRCPNVHIDVPLNTLKAEDVHIHYLWSDESNVTYERLIQPMLRDRPKIGSPKDVANVMLEVYGPNNREPYEMIQAGKVLHTRGARYAFDASIGTPNRTPSTSRPCHCAHYYFNQVCNRGASCAFIHVVSIDPTQREPCVKAANYHRRIAILAGDHQSPATVAHQPLPHQQVQRTPNTAMAPTMMGGHYQGTGAHGNVTNVSPNPLNYNNGNGNGPHITERIVVRDPREASSNNNSVMVNGRFGNATPMGGSSFVASSHHSPATHMASDQSMINTRNSPALSRFSNVIVEGRLPSATGGAQHQHSSPPTHLMGNNFNNSPAPSINHQTATPHQSPSSPGSNANSNASPTLATAPSNCSSPPPPPQQAFLPRSPSTAANIAPTPGAVLSNTSPSTPVPHGARTNAIEGAHQTKVTVGGKPSVATPPPPPASSLSPQNRPQANTNINSSFAGVGSRQHSEYSSHQQSYNAATLPADDFEDGGEFEQQPRYTASESTNNTTYNTTNNAGYHSPGGSRGYTNGNIASTGSPYCSRQTSSALIPADDVSPNAFNHHAPATTTPATTKATPNTAPTLSPRTVAYLASGMSPSVVVGDVASKASANYGSSPNQQRHNSNVFVSGMPFKHDEAAQVITVGGQVQRNLLPTNDGGSYKRTDSYFSETGTTFTNGPRNDYHHTPPPQHHQQLPPHLNSNVIDTNGPCGSSMFSPEGMVGVGMGGMEEKTYKGPMTPQTCGHNMGGGNTTTSYCNSPSCHANHITNSNMVTPKSARVPTGRFTHQPYTPPTAMYGTPMTNMHAGTV